MVNMFEETYSLGIIFRKVTPYALSRYSYQNGLGYRYTRIDAPHYVVEDLSLETISSERHSGFIMSKTRYNKIEFGMEGNFGKAVFTRPAGDQISFYGTSDFFYMNFSDNITYHMADYLALSAYVSNSGYAPIFSSTIPSIATSLGINLASYLYYVFYRETTPILGSVISLLQYYLIYKTDPGLIFYHDFSVGVQAGIKLDW